MRIWRLLLGLAGLALWAYGLLRFVEGNEILGGALMLAGGLLMCVAFAGGWAQFWDGVVNWLTGIGR